MKNSIFYYLKDNRKNRGGSMKLLKEKIMSEGIVLNDAILKVDSFLNHQIDAAFTLEMGKEIARLCGTF